MFHVEQVLSNDLRSHCIRRQDIILDRGVFHVEHQCIKDILWASQGGDQVFHVERPARGTSLRI
jgi:hypothetical protein